MNPALSYVVLKPKTFSGLGDSDIIEWVRDFEFTCTSNGWNDVIKMQKLGAFLVGPARNYYTLEILPNAELTWSDIDGVMGAKTMLLRAFLPCDYRRYLKDKLRNTKQEREEPIISYVSQMRYWAGLIDARMPEADIIDFILYGLHPSVSKYVMLRNPRTIDQLMEGALLVEETNRRFERNEEKIYCVKETSNQNENVKTNEIEYLKIRLEYMEKAMDELEEQDELDRSTGFASNSQRAQILNHETWPINHYEDEDY